MVLDPIPQSLPVHFFGSRPQPPTSRTRQNDNQAQHRSQIFWDSSYVCYEVYDPNTTNSKSKMLHLVDAQGRTTIMYNTAERQSGTTRQSDFAGLVIYMSSSVSSTYHELEHPKRYQRFMHKAERQLCTTCSQIGLDSLYTCHQVCHLHSTNSNSHSATRLMHKAERRSCATYKCYLFGLGMGWLRLVGALKL